MIKLSVWEGGITLAKVQIKVNDNGSFRVTGDVELVDSQGNAFPAKPAFSLCRCGLSKICLIATLRIKVNSSLLLEHQRQNNFTCDMHIFLCMFFLFSNSVISLLFTTFLILLFPFQPAYIFTQFFTFEYFLLAFYFFCAII